MTPRELCEGGNYVLSVCAIVFMGFTPDKNLWYVNLTSGDVEYKRYILSDCLQSCRFRKSNESSITGKERRALLKVQEKYNIYGDTAG